MKYSNRYINSDLDDEDKEFNGYKLKEAREKMRITRKDLASFLGIAPSYIGMIENGKRTPSVPTLKKICDFLEIRPGDVFYATKKEGLHLREGPQVYNAEWEVLKRKTNLILNMIETFDERELDHVISMIKSFKEYTNMTREGLDEY